MGLTLAKCPACGADLNLETDGDYFYCPHCGSKVVQKDNRIVIEHVNRTIDEAKVKRIELEERIRRDKKEEASERDANMNKYGKVLTAIGIAMLLLSFFTKDSYSEMLRVFSFFVCFWGIIFWAITGKKK